jgi:uncharacterized protein (DUF488 family)
MQVFTLGYQGLSLELYTETLVSAGVGLLIDVRETPWSYNRRYIKSVLERTMSTVDIDYLHLKECGNPSANRKTAKSIKECLTRYKRHLRQNSDCLITLLGHIRNAAKSGRPACLTCYEKEPHDCHRSILLDFLAASDPTISVTHLRPDAVQALPKIVAASPLFSGTTVQL